MSLSHVTAKSTLSASLSTLPGKDTNLDATSGELDATIASLTATIKTLKDLLRVAMKTETEWHKRVKKVKNLLSENGIEQFLSESRKEELEDLLSRAQEYTNSSGSVGVELVTEIKTFESHLEMAEEAKGKIALLLVTKNLDFFSQQGIGSTREKTTDNTATREIRSVIATAQALVSLREGK